jgi:hypothetical protein
VIKPEEKASLLQIKKQNKSPLAGAKRLNCQGASTTTYFLDESNNQERFQFFSIFTQTVSRAKIKPKKSQIKSHPTKSKEALIVRVHLPLHTSQVEPLIRKVRQKSSIGDLKGFAIR